MTNDRRILIADDDAAIRVGAAELLGPLGLEVLQAESGAEALALARGPELHLALLDFHMPDQTGLEVFESLRCALPKLPCILWSGDATDEVARYALRRGASAFLRKPVPPDFLRCEVQRVLEHHWGKAG